MIYIGNTVIYIGNTVIYIGNTVIYIGNIVKSDVRHVQTNSLIGVLRRYFIYITATVHFFMIRG